MSIEEVDEKGKCNKRKKWTDWRDKITKLNEDWQLFRGQSSNVELKSSLESYCSKFGIDLDPCAEDIEKQMIRQFKRVYDGDDRQRVQEDTLYCLSLMRHYGAPTRLLDFTYSKYVAIYFGLESAFNNVPKDGNGKLNYKANRECTVWCINQKELLCKAKDHDPEIKKLLANRREDKKRNDCTFKELYMKNRFIFAAWETPLQLHRRLHLQQGTFLCSGNIKVKLMDNLRDPYGERDTDYIPGCIKSFTYSFTLDELKEAFQEFMRMNITRESLFPGLDGLSMSMRYQLWHYKGLHDWIEQEQGILGVNK